MSRGISSATIITRKAGKSAHGTISVYSGKPLGARDGGGVCREKQGVVGAYVYDMTRKGGGAHR